MNTATISSQPALQQYGAAKIDGFAGFSAKKNMSPEQVNATAKEFESMFISQMTEQMFGESGGDSAFGTQETDDIYKSLMVHEYARIISNSGGIGIADYVKREMLKMQEKQA